MIFSHKNKTQESIASVHTSKAISLVDNRPGTIAQLKALHFNDNGNVVQLGKEGKMRAGMPAKAKAGTKEKQQSINQLALNHLVKYRADFCKTNPVTVADIADFRKERHELRGHASTDSNSKENPATTADLDTFVGWYRNKKGIGKSNRR